MSHPILLVIAGVSGSGKTKIGIELAQRLKVPFLEGDELHSKANIAKMKSGVPLDDSDREPWLYDIRKKAIGLLNDFGSGSQEIPGLQSQVVVIACSALKRKYRDILRGSFNHEIAYSEEKTKLSNVCVHFLYLKAQSDLIQQRLQDRKHHFVGVGLLPSQLNTLEEPDPAQENCQQSKIITLTLLSETGEPKHPKQIVDEAIHELVTKTHLPIMIIEASKKSLSSLPTLQNLFGVKSGKLSEVLGLLFEVSDSIEQKLIPVLQIDAKTHPLKSYDELITRCENIIKNQFTLEERVNFLGSHPRIGEVKNLSNLSSKEQGNVTDPEVLARLQNLNRLYEDLYPGLRYVTFVNGRTRREIVKEMENLLIQDGEPVKEVHQRDPEWQKELERGIADVFKIATSRLKSFNENST